MNWDAVGAVAETVGALAVLVTLIYLALQVRQNTAQQRREELVSIQHGQNAVVAQLKDPKVLGGYVRTAEERNPSIEDKAAAFAWVVQYLNHFQIVHDLYKTGSMQEEQYEIWASVAVSIVAPKGIWAWWNEEQLRLGFQAEVRELIDSRIQNTQTPPRPITEMWSAFSGESWGERSESGS